MFSCLSSCKLPHPATAPHAPASRFRLPARPPHSLPLFFSPILAFFPSPPGLASPNTIINRPITTGVDSHPNSLTTLNPITTGICAYRYYILYNIYYLLTYIRCNGPGLAYPVCKLILVTKLAPGHSNAHPTMHYVVFNMHAARRNICNGHGPHEAVNKIEHS